MEQDKERPKRLPRKSGGSEGKEVGDLKQSDVSVTESESDSDTEFSVPLIKGQVKDV